MSRNFYRNVVTTAFACPRRGGMMEQALGWQKKEFATFFIRTPYEKSSESPYKTGTTLIESQSLHFSFRSSYCCPYWYNWKIPCDNLPVNSGRDYFLAVGAICNSFDITGVTFVDSQQLSIFEAPETHLTIGVSRYECAAVFGN